MIKSNSVLLMALLSILFFSTNVNAQYHVISCNFSDTCGGYVGYDIAAISDSLTSAEISFGDGTRDTVSSGLLSSRIYYYLTFHHYSSGGAYTVKIVLFNDSLGRVDSLSSTDSGLNCAYVYGKIYRDVNGDCIYDAGDHLILAPMQIEIDSGSTAIDTISAYGYFYYLAHSTSATYMFSVLPSSFGSFHLSCTSGGSYSIVPSFGGMTHIGDFGFTCSGSSSSFDISLHAITNSSTFRQYVGLTAINNSCTPQNIKLTATIDTNYDISATIPSGTISGHTVTWIYSNLSIDSPQKFVIYCPANTVLPPGKTIITSAYINHISGDTDITNDSIAVVDTIKSSWDPNEKIVQPQGNIKPGDMLTYTLAFENTGNAPATNIHILDTLSSYVDPASIQIIASSHHVNLYKFIDVSSGRTILRFDFVNINLPDSSHHGQADGYVMFSISSKNGLTNGTQINNRAGIYFDDNEVVMTNTVTNTIHSLGIANVNGISPVSVYPNPVENDLYIKTKGVYQHLTIINNLGQVVLQQELHNNDSHINVKTLQPGMYYIMLKGNSGVKVEKIEKL